jgi:hypothetical protein
MRPGIVKKTISTQHSTWMEMALEDSSSAVVLGGGARHRLKIAAAALGGEGGRRTCNKGISIDVSIDIVKAKGLLLQC